VLLVVVRLDFYRSPVLLVVVRYSTL